MREDHRISGGVGQAHQRRPGNDAAGAQIGGAGVEVQPRMAGADVGDMRHRHIAARFGGKGAGEKSVEGVGVHADGERFGHG